MLIRATVPQPKIVKVQLPSGRVRRVQLDPGVNGVPTELLDAMIEQDRPAAEEIARNRPLEEAGQKKLQAQRQSRQKLVNPTLEEMTAGQLAYDRDQRKIAETRRAVVQAPERAKDKAAAERATKLSGGDLFGDMIRTLLPPELGGLSANETNASVQEAQKRLMLPGPSNPVMDVVRGLPGAILTGVPAKASDIKTYLNPNADPTDAVLAGLSGFSDIIPGAAAAASTAKKVAGNVGKTLAKKAAVRASGEVVSLKPKALPGPMYPPEVPGTRQVFDMEPSAPARLRNRSLSDPLALPARTPEPAPKVERAMAGTQDDFAKAQSEWKKELAEGKIDVTELGRRVAAFDVKQPPKVVPKKGTLLDRYDSGDMSHHDLYDALKNKQNRTPQEDFAISEYDRGYGEYVAQGKRMDDPSEEYLINALRSKPAAQPKPVAAKVAEPKPVTPKVVKTRDVMRDSMPSHSMPDTLESKLAWIRENGEIASDTNRRLRYVFDLSDGRKVSMEGVIRNTDPELWAKIKENGTYYRSAKGRAELFDKLPKEAQDQLLELIPTKDIADKFDTPMYQSKGNNAALEDWLKENAHPLAGTGHPSLKPVREAIYQLDQTNKRAVAAQNYKPVTPALTPKEPAAAKGKEPWEMTRDDYVGEKTVELNDSLRPKSSIERRYGKNPTPEQIKEYRAAQAAWNKNRNAYKKQVEESNQRFYDHKNSVESALKEGKPVPASVLADYPDLAAKYKPVAKVETPGVAPKTPEQAVSPIVRDLHTPRTTTKPIAAKGKPDKNGLQPDQKEFLTQGIRDAHEAFKAGATEPITIKVPRDGEFTVANTVQTEGIHKAVAGKFIELDPKVAQDIKRDGQLYRINPIDRPLLLARIEKGDKVVIDGRIETVHHTYGRESNASISIVDNGRNGSKPVNITEISAARLNKLAPISTPEGMAELRAAEARIMASDAAAKADKLAAAAEAAIKRRKQSGTGNKNRQRGAAMDPAQALVDYSVIAAWHIRNGARSAADILKKLIDETPQNEAWIRSNFSQIIAKSRDELKKYPKVKAPAPAPSSPKPTGTRTRASAQKKVDAEPAVTVGKPEATGLANQVQEREFAEGKISEVLSAVGIKKNVAQAEGKKAVESGRINPDVLADEVASGKRTFTTEEVGAAMEGKRRKLVELNDIKAKLDELPGNRALLALKATKEAELDAYNAKIQQGKGTWSDVGRAFQEGTTIDYGNPAEVLAEARRIKPNHKIEGRVNKLTEELTEVRQKLADLEASMTKPESAVKVIQDVQKTRAKGATKTRTNIKQERAEIWSQISKVNAKMSSGIDPQLVPLYGKILRTYVQEGTVVAKDLIARINQEIKARGLSGTFDEQDLKDALNTQVRPLRGPLSDYEKHLRNQERRTTMRIRAMLNEQSPRGPLSKVDSTLRELSLFNVSSRVLDVAANTTKLATYLAQTPVRHAVNKALGTGIDVNYPNVFRILKGAKGRYKQEFLDTIHGVDPDAIAKYGKRPGYVTRMTGSTDIVFKDFYTNEVYDAYAHKLAKGDNQVYRKMMDQLQEDVAGPLPAEKAFEIRQAAHEHAMRMTFMSDNIPSKMLEGLPLLIKDQTMRDAVVLIRNLFFRFSKVIGNVATDRVESSGVGLLTGGSKAVKLKLTKAGFTDIQARTVSDQIAKGFFGLGLTALGYYAYDNDILRPEIVKSAQNAWLDWGDIAQLGGVMSPITLGSGLRAIEKSSLKKDMKEKMTRDLMFGLLFDQPLVSGSKRLSKVFEDPAQELLGAVSGSVVPGVARDYAAREDYAQNRVGYRKTRPTQKDKGNKLQKRVENEVKARIPGLRATLPSGEVSRTKGTSNRIPYPFPPKK